MYLTETDEAKEIKARNFPSFEEVQAEYPDKTVIGWNFEGNMWDAISNLRTREVNRYLDSQVYDFAVCFEYRATRQLGSEKRYEYIEYIKEKISESNAPDIIFTGGRSMTDFCKEGINSYNRCRCPPPL